MTIDTIIFEEKNNFQSIALLGNGELKEIEFVEKGKATEGNVYLGKITRKIDLANGKTGYFVNIGDGHDAFLNSEELGMSDADFTEGQSLIIQVAQEKRAEKGAKVVRSLQFVGRNIVYRPFAMNVDASNKIEDKNAVTEYKHLVKENMIGQEGWLLRTNSVEVPFEEIKEEMAELREIYNQVRHKARDAKAPTLLSEKTNPLIEYIDKHSESLKKLVLNSHNVEQEVKDTFECGFEIEFNKEPFQEYLIEDALAEALKKEIKLKSGGRITIEETKACVAIDVDSGGDNGHGSISRLNNDAAAEIAKQIRLRNLAGKIIIDFAGSSEYRFIKPAMEVLEIELKKDYVKATCLGLSKAGNVEILRIRRRPTLQDLLTTECPTCQGTGRVEP